MSGLRDRLKWWVKSRDHYYVGYALSANDDEPGIGPNEDFESLLKFVMDEIAFSRGECFCGAISESHPLSLCDQSAPTAPWVPLA